MQAEAELPFALPGDPPELKINGYVSPLQHLGVETDTFASTSRLSGLEIA